MNWSSIVQPAGNDEPPPMPKRHEVDAQLQPATALPPSMVSLHAAAARAARRVMNYVVESVKSRRCSHRR